MIMATIPPWDQSTFVPDIDVLTQEELDSEEIIPTVQGKMFEPTNVCCKCHIPFKEYDMVVFRGKYYGVPCGCSKDIDKLIGGGK